MNRDGAYALPLKRTRYAIGAGLGASKHDGAFAFRPSQDRQQQRLFVLMRGRAERLADARRRRGFFADIDALGFVEELTRHPFGAAVHGRREHQGLPLSWDHTDDPPDLRHEAHIEQPVRFVDNHGRYPIKADGAAFDVVDQPPRTGD